MKRFLSIEGKLDNDMGPLEKIAKFTALSVVMAGVASSVFMFGSIISSMIIQGSAVVVLILGIGVLFERYFSWNIFTG